MTGKEIITRLNELEEHGLTPHAFAHMELDEYSCGSSEALEDIEKLITENEDGSWTIDGIGHADQVTQVGGEGQGDTWYAVTYFKDHDVYIRTDGWYQSYHGVEFDDGFGREVKPAEKTITVYE